MHHVEAHELADSWELRAGLLDADPADASISACLRECAAALRTAAVPNGQPKGMTPIQVRDGIADWIEANINHREFWTPEVVELIRSIEINERSATQAPARVAGPLFGTPPRADYVKAARAYAFAYGRHDDAPSYLPRTQTDADVFEPHAWVIGAMMQSFGDGWADGHAAGMAVMKEAAKHQAPAPAPDYPHERMDAIAVARYRVVEQASGFWGWGVVAGDGTAVLYKGHKKDCELVAQRLSGAFLDGGFAAGNLLAVQAPAVPHGKQP